MLIPRGTRSYFGALALASALLGAGNASATSVTTTGFQAWKTTLTGSPSEADFTAISTSNYNTASGLALATIGSSTAISTFTGPDNGGYQMVGNFFNGFTALEGSADAGAGLNVAVPNGGVNAFLLGVGTTGGTPLTIALSDGETFAITSSFFGISISHPISSFLLTTSAGSQVAIDDFYFGTSNLTQDPTGGSGGGLGSGDVAPSAEVATSLMMAGGCLFLFGAWRKFGAPNPA